jgi:hypothetical protein
VSHIAIVCWQQEYSEALTRPRRLKTARCQQLTIVLERLNRSWLARDAAGDSKDAPYSPFALTCTDSHLDGSTPLQRMPCLLRATLRNMGTSDSTMPPAADTANTNQHYVPQMLLRGFTTTKDGEQVWVFDKRTGKTFTTAIRAIAAERGYYDLSGSAVLDAAMNRADAIASGILTKIRNRYSLSGISLDDRGMLAGIVAMQMLRTRGYQETRRHIAQSLFDKLVEKTGIVRPDLQEYLAEDRLRDEYLRAIPESTKQFLPHLLNKDLLLFRTERNVPFCISDNPVALNNTLNPGDGIRGTYGLAVRGIEIYVPISRELTLGYLCPSIGKLQEFNSDQLLRVGGFINESAYNYLQARDTGRPLILNHDNVRFQNSLQALHAERFVISSVNEFTDVAEIVDNDPDARFGPRATAL